MFIGKIYYYGELFNCSFAVWLCDIVVFVKAFRGSFRFYDQTFPEIGVILFDRLRGEFKNTYNGGDLHMKHVSLFLTTTVLLSMAGSASDAMGATVTVDVATQHQKISGFGTCSAWCGTLSKEEGDLLFSTTEGAGLSLHRIMIERDGATQSETANTKLATSYGVTVWGTPWYCKNGVKVAGKDYDTLYESNYQEWADVLANTANTLKSAGTPLHAISSGNEADLGWTKFNPQALTKWVGEYLGPTMAEKAPDTKVMGIETCNWYGFSNYYKVFKADAKAWQYSSILATHLYGGSPTAYPDIQTAGKEFWQTEIYDTDTKVDPGMGSALRIAKLIHESLTIANMNAWHYWWIKEGGTNNGALWDKPSGKPAKRLWIMGNWSRYARPGFLRVKATAAPTAGVTISAFRDSSLSRVVIVAINTNSSATSQEFSLPGTSPKKVTPCITDPTQNLVEQAAQPLSSTTFSYSLPAQSVTSLVVDCEGTATIPMSNAKAAPQQAFFLNCSKSTLQLNFTAPASGKIGATLYTLNGNIVKTATFQTTAGTLCSRSLDCTKLPTGCYAVKIGYEGKTINRSKILLTK